MIRSDKRVRFTPNEVDAFRKIGIDFAGAKTQDDVESELAAWANTLADERPSLLDKIARELARAKGVKLPAKLSAVPSTDLPEQF